MTIITDLDGTLIRHTGKLSSQLCFPPELLPGTIDKLDEWEKAGHHIIILTGRPETYREQTVQQLQKIGIVYHQLIMGVGGSKRVLINDLKEGVTLADANEESHRRTATAVYLERNKGIEQVRL